MSFPIRAYLITFGEEGEWNSTVHRDLDSILTAWKNRPIQDSAAIIHIGFDRPATNKFTEIAYNHPGKMLLTAAAKFGMPKGFEASSAIIGYVEGIPIHIGTKGWGYSLDLQEDDSQTYQPKKPEPVMIAMSGWVNEFTQSMPEDKSALIEARIYDEQSYIENERNLDKNFRIKVGRFRFRLLLGDATDDCIAVAKASPPWLLERTIESLSVTVRISNVFTWGKINTVADLTNHTQFDLLRMPNFGRKSLDDLRDALLIALDEGPFILEEKIKESGATSLVQEIKKTLDTFPERQREILSRRMGLYHAPHTLQNVADSYGVTRERIRQIEEKCLKILIQQAYWDDLLAEKLKTLLIGRDYPLPVLGVEAIDKWFIGFSGTGNALRYILDNICQGRVGVTHLDGIDYLGFLKQKDWETALSQAKQFLQTAPGQDWSEEYCRSIVYSYLNEDAKEFRRLLWEKAIKLCHFSDNEGKRVLVSYGYGVGHAVEALLAEADTPLHYSKIAELTQQRLGREVDLRRAHNAASSLGIHFAPGTFGSEKHLGFTDDFAELICDAVEDILLNDTKIRQWHITEILSSLSERDDIDIEKLDKYKLNYILKRSTVLKSLKRMTWTEIQTGVPEMTDRIEIRQAIIRLLENAGRPLSTAEVKQQLIAVRGINTTFQIPALDPIIRLDATRWGLNDRDLSIKRDEQPALISKIFNLLEQKQAGVHISELFIDHQQLTQDLTSQVIVSIATRDARVRISPSQYLYLHTWGGPRRETLVNAIRNVLAESDAPMPFSELAEKVKTRTKLPLKNSRISACLYGVNAHYEPESQLWSKAEANDTDDNELEQDEVVGF